jgi:hypothetical protein
MKFWLTYLKYFAVVVIICAVLIAMVLATVFWPLWMLLFLGCSLFVLLAILN